MKSPKTFNLSRDVLSALKSWKEANPAQFSPSDLMEMLLREYLQLDVPVLTIGEKGSSTVNAKVAEIRAATEVKVDEFKDRFKKQYELKRGFEKDEFLAIQSRLSEEISGRNVSTEELLACVREQ